MHEQYKDWFPINLHQFTYVYDVNTGEVVQYLFGKRMYLRIEDRNTQNRVYAEYYRLGGFPTKEFNGHQYFMAYGRCINLNTGREVNMKAIKDLFLDQTAQ